MPLEDLETTLEPLLSAWKAKGGRRSFGDFVDRAGDERVQELLGVA
jgi:sulfite reductase (ferredoxin)